MADDEYARKMKDALSSFAMDTSSLENLAKSQAALAERLSSIAIEAAQTSTDLSAHWVQDTLSKLSTMTQANAEPAEYAKVAGDFASGSAQAAAENLAAFAEIAKKVQAETLALLMSAGKDMSEGATAEAKTTTDAGKG